MNCNTLRQRGRCSWCYTRSKAQTDIAHELAKLCHQLHDSKSHADGLQPGCCCVAPHVSHICINIHVHVYTHNYVYIHIYDCISLTHAHPRFLSATLSLLFRTGTCTNIYEYVHANICVHLLIYVYVKYPHVEVSARTACELIYVHVYANTYAFIFSIFFISIYMSFSHAASTRMVCNTVAAVLHRRRPNIYKCIYRYMYVHLYVCTHIYIYSAQQCVVVYSCSFNTSQSNTSHRPKWTRDLGGGLCVFLTNRKQVFWRRETLATDPS